MNIDTKHIRLGNTPANKTAAIREVGDLLVATGHIREGYIESMLGRERVANTYLGNGIAIPHGLPKNRDLILDTGIAILQIPDGVEWNEGEVVTLVVGIAARSDEHVDVLGHLTDLLDDEAVVKRLSSTSDAEEIIRQLTGQAGDAVRDIGEDAAGLEDFDAYEDVTIQEKTGLHARPATAFVEIAKAYDADVRVRHADGDRTVNGKSLASLLKLRVREGEVIRIMAQGHDADAALKALKQAVLDGLAAEDEEDIPVPDQHGWAPTSVGAAIPGVAASRGMAIGPIKLIRRRKIVVEATARDPKVEVAALENAILTAQADLQQLAQDITARSGAGRAAIFKAHVEFLNDPELVQDAVNIIHKGQSAGWAWRKAFTARVEELRQIDDHVLSARADDLNDVGTRVLRILAGVVDDVDEDQPDQPVILLAEDLTPSDTAGLDPKLILGICTAGGGALSHSAIIARSLGIPAIVGTGPVILHQPDGMLAVLDGNTGNLYLEPSVSDLTAAKEIQLSLADVRAQEKEHRYQPAITRDGVRVEVAANISRAEEAEEAVNAGGEGIGLLRTEFLFLERSHPPTEEGQYEAYSTMVKALNGLPLTARTLDIGGDKKSRLFKFAGRRESISGRTRHPAVFRAA